MSGRGALQLGAGAGVRLLLVSSAPSELPAVRAGQTPATQTMTTSDRFQARRADGAL